MDIIIPEVRSVDWNVDPTPEQQVSGKLRITATIGQVGTEGADDFRFEVCTLEWLKAEVCATGPMWPNSKLIVEKIDVENVQQAVQKLADNYRDSIDWTQFAMRMHRHTEWEFAYLEIR